jgi:hypothetical protein
MRKIRFFARLLATLKLRRCNNRSLKVQILPYCRRCGAKLEDYDHFCPKCGTPALAYTAPASPTQAARTVTPIKKDPIIAGGIALIVILIVAVVAVALLAAPLGTWNVNKSLTDQSSNIHALNLNFETDVGQVNVIALKVDNNNLGIYVVGNGSKGVFRSVNNPISVSFENTTEGDVLTINSKVNVETASSMNINLGIQIFVDPALILNLNVTSHAGQVSFSVDKSTTLQSLNLSTNAGAVDVTLQNVTITGPISLKTNAGTINYRVNNVKVVGNCTAELHSNAGSVNPYFTQTKALGGNMQVNVQTNLGSIDLALAIDGDVGAKITSETSLGSIHVKSDSNFHGDLSPLQSNNYPATSNIDVDCHANIGSVNIDANYQNDYGSSTIRN